MGIVNTFEKCLDSPYLTEDPEAGDQVGELLAKAGDRLEAAANLNNAPKGDPADVCLLAYEAMFCCIKALVYSKGYREAGLRCLLLACEHLFVHSGQLDRQHLQAFEQSQSLRLAPADALSATSALVKRTLELLRPA